LLLHAYPQIASKPKLVFVGDGPARLELEQVCKKEGYDAVFMGHQVGHELAECFASADVFAFPSFTEVGRNQSALDEI
jgi:glycosyltransferase involved in cell wall biosynthesis